MIVHIMAVPPTHDAITMSTVNVVRVILDADAVGAAEELAEASDACVVTVTWALVGMGATGVLAAAVGEIEAVDEDEVDNDETDELEDTEEETLELETVFVSKLTTLLSPKVSLVEDDKDAGVEGVLEEEGVFLDGVGVLDGLGVDCDGVLDATAGADDVLDTEGGSAPAPLATPGLALPPLLSLLLNVPVSSCG